MKILRMCIVVGHYFCADSPLLAYRVCECMRVCVCMSVCDVLCPHRLVMYFVCMR